jgi:phytoene/squalene synthetase
VCDSLRQIRPALADSVQRFEIPKALLAEIVRGVDADTRPNEIHSWNDLRQYSFQVASAVGLCCAAIWTEPGSFVQNKPLWNAAIDCGLAFQLTNILRDLVEDAQRHRVYLPSNELTLFGIDRARWLDTLARPNAKAPNAKELNDLGDWRGLLEVQLERADALYERGWRVIEHLESDGARMFSLMWQTYRTLFQKIQQSPQRVFSERVRLGGMDKWKLASSHFFTPQFHRCVHRTNQQIYRDTTRPLSTLASTLSTSSIETPQQISSTHSVDVSVPSSTTSLNPMSITANTSAWSAAANSDDSFILPRRNPSGRSRRPSILFLNRERRFRFPLGRFPHRSIFPDCCFAGPTCEPSTDFKSPADSSH